MAKKKTSPNIVGHFRNQYYAVAAGKCFSFFFLISPDFSNSTLLPPIANLIVFSHGSLYGWISPILPLLKSDDTPLTTGPLSSKEISWIVSIGSIGCVSAAFIYPSITNRIGCKRLMTSCLAIFSIVSHLHGPGKCVHGILYIDLSIVDFLVIICFWHE